MGGMFGESKFDVLEKVPDEVKPMTIRVDLPTTTEEIIHILKERKLELPVIFKPDLGERGWMVRKISNHEDIRSYLSQIRISFLIQELVTLPLEYGVFYVRYPGEESGRVTSITGKEMLSVTGDGMTRLSDLVIRNDRARLQHNVLKAKYADRWNEQIEPGQKIELVSVGNHCLGTKFINANHLITPKLSAAFDEISKKIDGFYFGRFDLRAASVEDLEAGKVKIVELNGCGAEPAHIYQPGYPLWKAVQVLFRHWRDIYVISTENHKRGVPYISLREARSIYRTFKISVAP